MSKERELLIEVLSEERELLRKFIDSKWVYDDWCLLKAEAEDLLAQPERDPVAYVYTTPPKREPLSDETIDLYCKNKNIKALEKLRFQQGVLFAEREHGIRK